MDSKRVLVHQVHPAKLATDIGASAASLGLLWRHHLIAGLVVHYFTPVLGSALVLRFADVDRLFGTSAGRYALSHMPAVMVAIRLAGDTMMVVGAWRRQTRYLVFGTLVVAIGWSHGLLSLRQGMKR